jgi:hypothetical protein
MADVGLFCARHLFVFADEYNSVINLHSPLQSLQEQGREKQVDLALEAHNHRIPSGGFTMSAQKFGFLVFFLLGFGLVAVTNENVWIPGMRMWCGRCKIAGHTRCRCGCGCCAAGVVGVKAGHDSHLTPVRVCVEMRYYEQKLLVQGS